MNNFLDISQLTRQQIESLIERARFFKGQRKYPRYPEQTVAHLFYENSTRTRLSFELAARHLSMQVLHLDVQHSSEAKGEGIEDTFRNLAAMGVTVFVLRHKQEGIQEHLAERLGESIALVNAGDGTHAHPSQALLDVMTILEQKTNLSDLKIAILGNILHSRVANSMQSIAAKLGVGELVLIAPEIWQPKVLEFGRVTQDIKEGLSDADVVMCLRVQKERLLETEHLDLQTYRKDYALTQRTLAYAKPQAMILHPGPINRGVEIDSELADGPQSFILEQVRNGVYARMAILESLI